MALTNAYLLQVSNLGDILRAIRGPQAPEKFTTRFLLQLGFKSTNDRNIIGVMKGLNFIDDSGRPTQRYFDYLDETQHKAIIAQAIQEAYADLFKVNNAAQTMSVAELKSKLKTLTQGTKGESVLSKMAATFAALCKEADFSTVPADQKVPEDEVAPDKHEEKKAGEQHEDRKLPIGLSYAINIELPSTRDQGVYDAIFRSLKEHIL